MSWGPQQRLLAHQLLLQLLPMAADGLKEHQAALLLSAVWHGAALGSNGPAAFVAMDCLLRTLLGSAPAAALLQAVRMLAALQLELLQADAGSAAGAATPAADGLVATVGADGSRLAALSPAQGCALLCMCGSALSALAAQLGQPALQRLAVPDSCGALQCLACAPPHGLLLPGLDGAAGQAAGSPEAVAEQQQFWQGPAVSLAFTAAEQAAAAAFLAQLRAGATLAAQQAALAAALEAVPLLKQQLGSSNSSFRPVPLANMMPRLLAQVCCLGCPACACCVRVVRG